MNKNYLFATIFAFYSIVGMAADQIQGQMLANLQTIKSVFYANYAPQRWKASFANWDLDREISKIENNIRFGSIRTIKEYDLALANFFNSTRDYHVGVHFLLKEKAQLPIQIKGAEGRFFLVYIDRNVLSPNSFPFSEGDEIINFGGRPVQQVIDELKTLESNGNSETQQALAELSLTGRAANRGFPVPRGPIQLDILKKGSSQPTTITLQWSYTPESAAFANGEINPLNSLVASTPMEDFGTDSTEQESRASVQRIFNKKMLASVPIASASTASNNNNLFRIGGRKSYVPDLGQKIFENDKGFFHTRIFRLSSGKRIGVVRIPSYEADEPQTLEFTQLIKFLQNNTDALVIDQVSNPGGSVPFLYSLASLLTDKPLVTAKHHIALTQADVIDAENTLAALSRITDESTAHATLGNTIGGYPVTMKLVGLLSAYSQKIQDEWQRRNRLSQALPLIGLESIDPHPEVNYSKQILILVDNLDFSGGDFFPAMMQDNKRAKILGTRTSGAGGFVLNVTFNNLLGIKDFSLTGSIAERMNSQPIENLGVTPDILYRITANDLQNGMSDFRSAILNALQ